MQTIDDTFIAQRQVAHYRGRVAATQGAIANWCEYPLDDLAVIQRLDRLCSAMVAYREHLNYWIAKLAACEATAPITPIAVRKCKMCKCESAGIKRGLCPECIIELE